MNSRTLRDAAVGLVYLVVIAALVLLSIMIYNHDFSSYVTVSLRTATSGNALQKGSDVKVRGVIVGQVSSVSAKTSGSADVHIDLDPDKAKQLPTNVTGQLLPKTLFGEQYVSLTIPAQPARSHLSSGDHIQPDTSPGSIELQKLFNDLLPVLRAVRPDQLSATLGEFAAALRGPVATDLSQLVQTLGPYLRKFAPHVPTLSADLDALAKTAGTYTQAAPDIVNALNSFTTTSRTLVRQRQDFEASLRALTSLSDTAGNFVSTSQNDIIGLAGNSLPTLRSLARYSTEFPCLARALVDYIPKANNAFGAGTGKPGARVVLHVIPKIAPYGPGDAPVFNHDNGPRCPYTPATTLASTALAQIPGVQGASAPSTTSTKIGSGSAAATTQVAGLGTANSPQENELIAELVAPSLGLKPAQVPPWASLVLGPALRGTQVSLR